MQSRRVATIATAVAVIAVPAAAHADYTLTRDVSANGSTAKAKGCNRGSSKYGAYKFTGKERYQSFTETVKWVETIKNDGRRHPLRFVSLHTNQGSSVDQQATPAVRSFVNHTTAKLIHINGRPFVQYKGSWGSSHPQPFNPRRGC